jgi:predicted DsbA family dithiol-disulfide isomerase
MAQRAGVASTPSFLIGRIEAPGSLRVLYRLQGTRPYPMLVSVLEDVLASD